MNIDQNAINEPAMQAKAGTDQYLTFLLDEEEYGVNILSVQEIKCWDTVTPMPNTQNYILGVINLRGTVIPIVDLRLCFNMPAAIFGPTTVVIVLKVLGKDRERVVGLVVDAVSEVYNVSDSDTKPAPDVVSSGAGEFIKGLATVEEKMVILLDIDKVMNSNLFILEEKVA